MFPFAFYIMMNPGMGTLGTNGPGYEQVLSRYPLFVSRVYRALLGLQGS